MSQQRLILAGQEAVDLWKKGKDAWNAWVDEHPEADIDFSNVDFSSYKVVSFDKFRFPNGDVSFFRAKFGQGDVIFNSATFGEGDVSFAFTKVEGAMFSFSGCTLQKGRYDFSNMRIDARAHFDGLKNTERPTRFSFQNTSFEQAVVFAGHFRCVPDFRGTKTLHHMDINELRCDLRREDDRASNGSAPQGDKIPGWYGRLGFRPLLASDKEDAARLRRLKEIAESNRHHTAALRFHADEMRAMRWLETGFFASVLGWIYDKLSNYGQSLWRPLCGWLFTLLLLFPALYWNASLVCHVENSESPACPGMESSQALTCWENRLSQALSVSFGNSIPFAPTARGVRQDGLKALFGKDPSLIVDLLTLCQGVASFIFLFLIGLALRNRFRI